VLLLLLLSRGAKLRPLLLPRHRLSSLFVHAISLGTTVHFFPHYLLHRPRVPPLFPEPSPAARCCCRDTLRDVDVAAPLLRLTEEEDVTVAWHAAAALANLTIHCPNIKVRP
jgi:hypothetical protein